MRGMDSNSIDLIYLDPPFNTKKNYKAPIGSPAEGASFKDIWTDEDVKHEWHGEVAETNEELYQIIQAAETVYDKSMKLYLMAMAVRLFEMHRLLKDTGSIYLHCDPTASHYLKLVMDSLFGRQNFVMKLFGIIKVILLRKRSILAKHDTLLYYASRKSLFNPVLIPYAEATLKRYNHTDEDGRRIKYQHLEKENKKKFTWKEGKPVDDVWDIPVVRTKTERTGYPTQKAPVPVRPHHQSLLQRKRVVLDPFCGCATACVAAEQLQRQWIGIDISPSAETITKIRLEEASEQGQLFSPITMSDVTVSHEPPIRTDTDTETAVQRRLPAYQAHKHELLVDKKDIVADANCTIGLKT